MQTDRPTRLTRLVVLLTAVLLCFGTNLGTAPAALAKDDPKYHLGYGPDSGKQCPVDFSGGAPCGIDKQGHYCIYDLINDDDICRMPEAGEQPGTVGECENAGGDKSPDCDDKTWQALEKKKLDKWRKANQQAVREGNLSQADYDKWNTFLTDCLDKNKGWSFQTCNEAAYKKYGPIGGQTLADWVGKKISELARDALEEAAQYIGNAVLWLLEKFADVFTKASVINLDSTGIAQPTGIAMALSVVIAVFLLLLQFGKVAISHQGGPAATAISGLAKWAVILSAYWTVTTTALQFSDQLSDWIVNYSFHSHNSAAHGAASDALKAKFGEMFAGLIGSGGAATAGGALITGQGVAASAVAVVIVIGIVCILAIGALWIEILLRQAGIMILLSTMPIVLVGQMSDATKDWWPKARDALLALILMKPMIVFCFAIGFFAIDQGQGVQNMLVGLLIFLMACFCWPAIAKFMTFSSLGAGAAMAGGLISSLGSSAASMGGGYRPQLGGAGAVGGGPAYTRALERDNAQTQASGANTQGGGGFWTNESLRARLRGPGGRLGTRVAGPLGLGLQVMAMGKDTLESGMANTAAHAGLDSASPGGRHVVIPPRGPDTAGLPPAAQERAPQPRPDTSPVITGPPNTDIPSSREG
ncbi:hypothetical protein ACIPSA_47505 [Streptomyces sp. NPDC086549]|uniref:hypothetical protein n=1 Tax=Streptomyces sp. NPDC086549 TaxID=3365752 RepID=UPI0037FEE659